MVVIFAPLAALTGIEHERTGRPFMCTVHAPHCATPQPYLVPVRPTCSRITQSRGVVGSTWTSWDLPLIVRRIATPPLSCGVVDGRCGFSRPDILPLS